MIDALPRPHPTVHAVLLASLLLLLGACNAEPERQPGEGPGESQIVAGDDLVQGALGDVPVPNAADAAGTSEVQGVQTQSFTVTAMSPSDVQNFYREELPELGWSLQDEDDLGPDLRTTWTMNGQTLLVAVAPQGDTTDSSLSLQLSDEGEAFLDDGES